MQAMRTWWMVEFLHRIPAEMTAVTPGQLTETMLTHLTEKAAIESGKRRS